MRRRSSDVTSMETKTHNRRQQKRNGLQRIQSHHIHVESTTMTLCLCLCLYPSIMMDIMMDCHHRFGFSRVSFIIALHGIVIDPRWRRSLALASW